MSGTWDDLIGKPYELNATGPDSYDCFGLATEVLDRMGFPLDMDIASHWIRSYFPGKEDIELVSEHFAEIDELPRKRGDLLVMRGLESEGRATHVAVHLGENLVIQSTKKIGVHIVAFSVVAPYTVEVITWK